MDDRLLSLETAVRDLEHALAQFDRRLSALERGAPADARDDDRIAPLTLVPPIGRGDIAQLLAYVGRSFVVLGGAFLLRAITDANLVPHAVGITAGLTYGLAWLWMADRVGATERLNGAFHGLVSAIIAYPLLWEATVRFGVLAPPAAAAGITAVTAAAYIVALRRRRQAIAWIATIAAVATSVALVAATAVLLPFALFLIACGTATLWIGYAVDWTLLRWPVALAADLLIIGLTMRVAARTGLESPFVAVAVQLLLLNAYIASIAIRTLVRARNVNAFEVVQTLAAVAVGFGGAVYVAHSTGAGLVPLAIVNLAAGAACYAIAWVFVASRQGLSRNFYFYTSLGIVLLIVSSELLLDDGALVLALATFGLVATAVSRRSGRVALVWHAAVYLIAAAIASGVIVDAADALVGSAAVAWRPFTPSALIVIVAAFASWTLAAGAEYASAAFVVPRVMFAALAIWSVGGWIVAVVTPPLCGTPGAGAAAGAVATIRTTVVATAALATAWLAARPRFREAVWLLYVLLLAGALKLLVEDLPQSQPATLFVALAFYGAALIAASRLGVRRASSR
jgi:hypothetical protein